VSVHKLSGSNDTALECNSCVSFCFVPSLTADSDGFVVTSQTAIAKICFVGKLSFSNSTVVGILLSVTIMHQVHSIIYHNEGLPLKTRYLRAQGVLGLFICV
jgi:hypothetical protein